MKKATTVFALLVLLIVCSVVCAACTTSSAPSKPQYPKLAENYSGPLNSDTATPPELLSLESVDQASDGSFAALLYIFDGPYATLYTTIGDVKPFAGGKAPFTMHALASDGSLDFTGTVSQQTGTISGTVALHDANNTTATWTLTPSASPTPTSTSSS